MLKLIAHKQFSAKYLFRVTGSTIYNSPGWSVVNTSFELKTFLSEKNPSIISIGELRDSSVFQTAQIIKKLYDLGKQPYPTIVVISNDIILNKQIKSMFKT